MLDKKVFNRYNSHCDNWGEPMVLDLKRFLNGGVESLDIATSLDYTDEEYLGEKLFAKPVLVTGKVFNRADVTRLSLNLVVLVKKPCDRCGKETERTFNFNLERVLVKELEGEEYDDILLVEDDKLDLFSFCLSEIILLLPLKFLCSDDCKGVCTVCGTNLNTGDCSCVKKVIDPRLKALAQLLEDDSEN